MPQRLWQNLLIVVGGIVAIRGIVMAVAGGSVILSGTPALMIVRRVVRNPQRAASNYAMSRSQALEHV